VALRSRTPTIAQRCSISLLFYTSSNRYRSCSLMKLSIVCIGLAFSLVQAFSPSTPVFARIRTKLSVSLDPKAVGKFEEQELNEKLAFIAHKLKLQTYDVDTSVYGFDSKDFHYGIENIRTSLKVDPSLGLELTEVAHSDLDDRGLVLVTAVSGNAVDSRIQTGDTIVGVFAGEGFKESTTAMSYEDTMDTIKRAKENVGSGGTIDLELNRLVKKAKVKVIVEDGSDEPVATIDGLAGDNLRLLLMHSGVQLYDKRTRRLDMPQATGDCGGEAVCGTCLVAVQEGGEALNKKGPQESEVMTGRPAEWRAACCTVIGADNKEATIRVRVHPQSGNEDELLHPGEQVNLR